MDEFGEGVGDKVSEDYYEIEGDVGNEIGEDNNMTDDHTRFRDLDVEAREASGVAYGNGEAIEASGEACGNSFNPRGGENMSQVKVAERRQEATKRKVPCMRGDESCSKTARCIRKEQSKLE